MSDDKIDNILLQEIRILRKEVGDMNRESNKRFAKLEVKVASVGSFFGSVFGIVSALVINYFK